MSVSIPSRDLTELPTLSYSDCMPCMADLDALGWAEGIAVTSYGINVGIRVSEPGWLERIEAELPPGWRHARTSKVEQLFSVIIGGEGPRRGVRRLNLVYRGFLQAARHREVDPVMDALKSEIRLWVAERSTQRVFVHAGVVEWQGQAILLPGRSYSGKSTMVAELLKAGATYYSDEFAVLDDKGRAHPFPLPISTRQPGQYDSVPVSAESFGAPTGRKPIPVGAIAVSRYQEGAHWRPRRVSKGEGALALMANTVSARRHPQRAMVALKAAASDAVILKGVRGEASDAAAHLTELIGARPGGAT